MENNPNILYLARWYPNRYDPMPGLFIRRHAEAANKHCKIGVVYTHVVEQEKVEGFEVDLSTVNGVSTIRVYYNNPGFKLPLVSPILKAFRFFKANQVGIRSIKNELPTFNVIHVHVLTRLGIIALWFKWFRGIPFMISEHWSRYLPVTGDYKGIFRKWITRIVVKNASIVTTVTQNLADAMQSHGLKNSGYKVLGNVVAEGFFTQKPKKKPAIKKITFIHVSCFEDKSKNISGLLHVIKSLSIKRDDFIFKMVGEGMDYDFLKNYANEIDLDESVMKFTGLLEGNALVAEMRSADLMVIFSNYENFPVVINESFVLGVPVIATSVGGIPEFVNDSNGRLIKVGDEIALENLLVDYLDGKLTFDSEKIKLESGSAFSSETVGMELYNMYKSILISS